MNLDDYAFTFGETGFTLRKKIKEKNYYGGYAWKFYNYREKEWQGGVASPLDYKVWVDYVTPKTEEEVLLAILTGIWRGKTMYSKKG